MVSRYLQVPSTYFFVTISIGVNGGAGTPGVPPNVTYLKLAVTDSSQIRHAVVPQSAAHAGLAVKTLVPISGQNALFVVAQHIARYYHVHYRSVTLVLSVTISQQFHLHTFLRHFQN